MVYKNSINKSLLMFSIVLLVLFNQSKQAYAWFFDFGWRDGGHRYGSYTQVVVGGDRYYYDAGIFYRGNPGNYVVVEAPVGAVVYNIPPGCERVEEDGAVYFVYGDVYYRPVRHGYEVIRIGRPHHGQGHAYGHYKHRHDDDRWR